MADEQDQANSTAVSEKQSQDVSQDRAQSAIAGDTAAPVQDPRIAILEQEVKSLKGRLMTRVPDEELAGIKQELRRLRREIIQRDSDMDAGEKNAELSKLTVQEQQENASAAFLAHEEKLREKMNAKFARSGVDKGHPKLKELEQAWQAAKTTAACDEVYDTFIDFLDEEKEARVQAAIKAAEKKAQTAEQRFNQESGTLDVAVSGGVPAGAGTVHSYVQRLKKGEKLPSPEEIDRLTAAYLR